MGELCVLDRTPNDEVYDQLSAQLDRAIAAEERISAEIARIRKRFLANDLRVTSGPREGQPLTRHGRVLLWDRLESLLWRRTQLLEEQSRLYMMATRWRPAPQGDQFQE
jgi:hypothetical protein